jgi:hypothetical protein
MGLRRPGRGSSPPGAAAHAVSPRWCVAGVGGGNGDGSTVATTAERAGRWRMNGHMGLDTPGGIEYVRGRAAPEGWPSG